MIYVIENLGQGFAMTSSYAKRLQSEREQYVQLLLKMYWTPAEVQRELQAEKLRAFSGPQKRPPLEIQRALQKRVPMQAAMQKFLKRQFEQWAKEQAKDAQAMDSLFQEFNQEDTLDILTRLKDEEPINRWMAIQVAQRRWEKLESFLIESLEDPAPMVRQAAHQALVRLSRGNDFGPAGANPNREQIRVAQKNWRGWLEMQDR